MIIDGIEYVPVGSIAGAKVDGLSPVIVRCTGAGCHFGYLVSRTDNTATLRKSRRLWSWSGAFTLSELAESGPDVVGSRFGVELTQDLELAAWHEILGVSAQALAKIALVKS